MDSKIHTLLRWVGGKWRNVDTFESFLPPGFRDMFYVEPFAGSAAMLIRTQPRMAMVFDINADLINVYLDIKENPEDVIKGLSFHDKNDCEVYYYKVRSDFNLGKAIGDGLVEGKPKRSTQSARFLYLNARCFNGLYRENSKGEMNSPFAKDLKGMKRVCDPDNVRGLSRYFNENDIIFENRSYDTIIPAVEKRSAGSKVFFFLDPPYYPISETASFTAYNKDVWDHEKFKNLRAFVDDLNARGWLFLLCNHSVDAIKSIFKGYNQTEHVVSRSVSCKAREREPVTEIVVSNYKVKRRFKEVETL